jgi:hypothetical protein
MILHFIFLGDTGAVVTRQKVHETPISTDGWVWWYKPVIPATWGSTIRRVRVQVHGHKSEILSQK